MKNIIEYYYNIRIDELYNKKDYYFFDINGSYYIFKPYSSSLERSNDIYNINMFLNNMIRMDNIILNRYNEPTTNINNINYILVRRNDKYPLSLINIANMANMNNMYLLNMHNLERNNWEILWSNMIDYYEEQIGENSKKYPLIRESIDYYIGLTENAISYVVNTKNNIHKEVSDMMVLSHSTLEKGLNDPENIILDHKARDVAEYIKWSFFNNNENIFNELDEYFKYNYYSFYGIQILFGRILYPSFYFNVYDKIISRKIDEKELNIIISKNKEYEYYLYQVYLYLNKYYNLDAPEWIKKQGTNPR